MTKTPNTQPPLQGDIVLCILDTLGGVRPTAQKLKVSVSTVQGWKQRKMIPENRYYMIQTYFNDTLGTPLATLFTELEKKSSVDIKDSHLDTPKITSKVRKDFDKKIPKTLSYKGYILAIVMGGIMGCIGGGVAMITVPYWYPKSFLKTAHMDIIHYDTAQDRLVLHDTQDMVKTIQARLDALESDVQSTQQIQGGLDDINERIAHMRADIETFKKTVDIDFIQNSVHRMELYNLYTLIQLGQSYETYLNMLSIPKYTQVRADWEVITAHANGVITTQHILDAVRQAGVFIAPALAYKHAQSPNVSVWDRVKASFKHMVFVVQSPTSSPPYLSRSDTDGLGALYHAIQTDDMAYVLRTLRSLDISDLAPMIDRIETRMSVIHALENIRKDIMHRQAES